MQEAVTRYVDDQRYRETWNVAIAKHALTHGFGAANSPDEWLRIFRTYGLKVRE